MDYRNSKSWQAMNYRLQLEINRHKVDINQEEFRKTPEERAKLKRLKREWKQSQVNF